MLSQGGPARIAVNVRKVRSGRVCSHAQLCSGYLSLCIVASSCCPVAVDVFKIEARHFVRTHHSPLEDQNSLNFTACVPTGYGKIVQELSTSVKSMRVSTLRIEETRPPTISKFESRMHHLFRF